RIPFGLPLGESRLQLCGHQLRRIWKRHQKEKRSYMVRYGFERIATSYQNGGHVICFGTLLFKRALFERIGGLTSFLKGAEDYEWITRALNQGFYVDNLKEQLYYYRSHPGQLSRLVKSTRRLKRPWEYVLELGSLD